MTVRNRANSHTLSPASMPISSHTPAPYDGPSRDEVLAMRRQYLTPGSLTHYCEPLMIVEGHMQYVWDETGRQYLDAFARYRHGFGRPLSPQGG